MEPISVFDMLKIGIGPSSSHTLGPWRAAERFANELADYELLPQVAKVDVHLYGSLALTGRGHGTDIAVQLGLAGEDPVTIPVQRVTELPAQIAETGLMMLHGDHSIAFQPLQNIIFHFSESLPFHANGMQLCAYDENGNHLHECTFYSVGGGFVVKENEEVSSEEQVSLPFPIDKAVHLWRYCLEENAAIWEIVLHNEKVWRKPSQIKKDMLRIWETMKQCMYRGCHTKGTLPGGLHVNRRAAGLNQRLMCEAEYDDAEGWIKAIRMCHKSFTSVNKWIGCFAMAVNEENANFGRVVTAPTNGAAGVIPAVLMYYLCFHDERPSEDDIVKFLMTAAEIGSLFKKGATISAAMGGCQAEIGVSSAMAAGALTERLGGTVGQALMASEIAMEHHLGLTCDPIGGLVQVPCIERNSMGAIKAITAAHIALESDPDKAKVPLDACIKTMWQTAKDMSQKYKETSQGGLAVNISIQVPEC